MAKLVKTADPMKDPKFLQVVQTFLRTPPTPRKPRGEKKAKVKPARKIRRSPPATQ
jgi:hypothetical protein